MQFVYVPLSLFYSFTVGETKRRRLCLGRDQAWEPAVRRDSFMRIYTLEIEKKKKKIAHGTLAM